MHLGEMQDVLRLCFVLRLTYCCVAFLKGLLDKINDVLIYTELQKLINCKLFAAQQTKCEIGRGRRILNAFMFYFT